MSFAVWVAFAQPLAVLFVMSAATLGMGLVPSYAQWGVAASALMVVLRLLQGFCLGGELPGALGGDEAEIEMIGNPGQTVVGGYSCHWGIPGITARAR